MLFSIANAGSDGSLEIKSKSSSGEINDCFEKVNRGIFAFNQGLDKVIFKPLATGYRKLPQPVRSGASAGDHIYCCQGTTGVNRTIRAEIWVQ